MASHILANVAEKTKDAMSAKSVKVAQLESVTKDVHAKDGQTITTDYGVKQTNTDHWLKVVSEDKNGPSLLEDAFGREKV